MDRYAAGLKVPQIQIEPFYGKTTDADGRVDIILKYTPKSLGHLFASLPYTSNTHFAIQIEALVGKFTRVRLYKRVYYAASGTSAENSGNVGADPHSHSITKSTYDLEGPDLNNVTIPAFSIIYEVA